MGASILLVHRITVTVGKVDVKLMGGGNDEGADGDGQGIRPPPDEPDDKKIVVTRAPDIRLRR